MPKRQRQPHKPGCKTFSSLSEGLPHLETKWGALERKRSDYSRHGKKYGWIPPRKGKEEKSAKKKKGVRRKRELKDPK